MTEEMRKERKKIGKKTSEKEKKISAISWMGKARQLQ